jgi:hypothetical protein
MGHMKRFIESVSNDIGERGEINEKVLAECSRRLGRATEERDPDADREAKRDPSGEPG